MTSALKFFFYCAWGWGEGVWGCEIDYIEKWLFSSVVQLEIYSRCYSEQPLVIQGAGAGNDTTAAGVLADILDIQDLFP